MNAFRPSLMPELPLEAAANAQAQAEPLDLVFIEGFVGHTVIGIHAGEFHATQPLVIDVCCGLPRARACDTDQINDTIDYSVLRERLRRLMTEHGVTLLEALAEQIAHIALTEFSAHWVRVRVVKPKKFDDVEALGVQIERRRSLSAPPAPTGGAAVLTLIGSGMVPGRR
jgi:7,8-dihydroneopterin aldolase/epimerase/oxygenase